MGLMQDLQRGDKERRAEVATMLSEADAFVKELAKGSAQRVSDVASTLGDFAKEDAKRRSDVASMLSEADAFVKELTKGSARRASDVAGMLRGLAREDAKRRSEVGAIREEVWGTAPAKKKTAPAVVEKTPVGELHDRVFAYLANHPNGTKLTELEEEFGVARSQMARVVRELMDSNKIEKREQFYFAI